VYVEIPLERPDLFDDVLRACSTREPLGAYATNERLNYLFVDGGAVCNLCAARDGADAGESVARSVPLFDWHEREMRDTHGVELTGLPVSRALFVRDGVVPPALTAEGEGVTIIVVGPVHAGIIEPGRFTFSSGGETVVHLDGQLSYSRRGVEAFLEGCDAFAAAPQMARVCGACSVARSWAYARAIETLAGVACDERTEWARLIFAELERIYNHVFDLGSTAASAGYGYGQTQGLAIKERVHRVCAAAGGHRFLFDAIVPGGVRIGALDAAGALRSDVAKLRSATAEFLDALFGARSVVGRFEGAGRVPRETARAFGAVGPARRASGAAIDMRAVLPYGAYRKLPPEVFSETAGDVAARCRIKRAEIGASFELIDRALAEFGTLPPPPPQRFAAARGRITTVTEGARGAESVSVECDARGHLTRVHIISASYRNWPLVLRAMEGNIVPDFPLVNKSFNLCYACADR
jgi:Ni,Fe-hydrogenase III large subunit